MMHIIVTSLIWGEFDCASYAPYGNVAHAVSLSYVTHTVSLPYVHVTHLLSFLPHSWVLPSPFHMNRSLWELVMCN